MVAIEGSTESPRPPLSIGMVRRKLGGQKRWQHGHLTGSIESALRFNGAGGSQAEAIFLVDLVTVRYVAFSLGSILVDYAVGGAIAIAHGDCNGDDEDGRDSVRCAAKSGSYCSTKTTPPNETFALRVLQNPLRSAVLV